MAEVVIEGSSASEAASAVAFLRVSRPAPELLQTVHDVQSFLFSVERYSTQGGRAVGTGRWPTTLTLSIVTDGDWESPGLPVDAAEYELSNVPDGRWIASHGFAGSGWLPVTWSMSMFGTIDMARLSSHTFTESPILLEGGDEESGELFGYLADDQFQPATAILMGSGAGVGGAASVSLPPSGSVSLVAVVVMDDDDGDTDVMWLAGNRLLASTAGGLVVLNSNDEEVLVTEDRRVSVGQLTTIVWSRGPRGEELTTITEDGTVSAASIASEQVAPSTAGFFLGGYEGSVMFLEASLFTGKGHDDLVSTATNLMSYYVGRELV